MSFESQLNIQSKLITGHNFDSLGMDRKAQVYKLYLDNERNHQLQRIADKLEVFDLTSLGNQLLDIAYQAGLNFRGQGR